MGKIYKNAIGVDIKVSTGKTMSGATLMQLLVKKPDGTEVVWTTTTASGTTIIYKTAAGDLNQSGVYVIQAYVEWGDVSKHYGEATTFKIFEKYG